VGLIAGLCIAFATVLLVDRFDDRLFEAQSLSEAAGTPLVIAISKRISGSSSGRLPEPYALARANLLAQNPDLTKLLVVAASPSDRVRHVAAGLGIACVQAGLRVLVFSDVRRTVETLRLAGLKVSASVLVADPEKEVSVNTALPEPALYDMAVNQSKLPTWRGPNGS
jgi:hypothetical protein